jgi:hypothetical protein
MCLCSMPGPPITNDTAVVKLLEHGVTVGLGVQEANTARNARFDLTWVSTVNHSDSNYGGYLQPLGRLDWNRMAELTNDKHTPSSQAT